MFFAYYYEPAEHHSRAHDTLSGIVSGELPYGPLFTTQAVLSELTTLLLRKSTHTDAIRALTELRESESFNQLVVDQATFDTAIEQFKQYDDQTISFVDHTTAVLAAERDIDHVLGFDSDFQTLGFTRVPPDTGLNG
jgi:predicted nucleic acid-binding protein